MLLKAAKDFNIDLTESWIVGDDKNDIQCGQNAGCQTCLIGKESKGIQSDLIQIDLLSSVHSILKIEEKKNGR